MDSTTVGIISTAVAGAAGWFGKQGMDWYLKYKADKREDVKLSDQREDVLDEKEDKTLRYIIGIQQGELTSLRAEIKELQASYRTELETMRSNHRTELTALHGAHNDCELRYTALETEMRIRLQAMDSRMGKVEEHVDPKLVVEVHDSHAITEAVKETKAAIRTGVHDVKDAIHAASMTAQADKAESK